MISNKSNFIPYLQLRLEVDNLTFESEVEIDLREIEPRKEAVSEIDRLKELQNVNPAVKSLIERLGLDFQ